MPHRRSRAAAPQAKYQDAWQWGLGSQGTVRTGIASVVMTAPLTRKRIAVRTLMRNACSGIGQHPLRDGNDLGGRNAAHAGMIIHRANGPLARLAGRRCFG